MDTNALVKQRQQQLDQIYNPQIDLVKQQMQAIPQQFEGQRSALDQAKTNAFRDISQKANRRGMFFSGFQPQEQARYLGTEYLPGLQNLDAQQNQARLGLMEQLTGIRGQRAQTMTDFQEQLRQERVARQQREEDFQREQQMQRERLAAQRAASGGGSSYNRTGSGRGNVRGNDGSARIVQQALPQARQSLQAVAGPDGYVNPADYRTAKNVWTEQLGLAPEGFDSYAWQFINPSHASDYTNNRNILSRMMR